MRPYRMEAGSLSAEQTNALHCVPHYAMESGPVEERKARQSAMKDREIYKSSMYNSLGRKKSIPEQVVRVDTDYTNAVVMR